MDKRVNQLSIHSNCFVFGFLNLSLNENIPSFPQVVEFKVTDLSCVTSCFRRGGGG